MSTCVKTLTVTSRSALYKSNVKERRGKWIEIYDISVGSVMVRIQESDDVGGVLVVASEEAQSNCRNRIVTPRLVQTTEERTRLGRP